MKLTPADWVRVGTAIVGILGALNTQLLQAMGIAPNESSHIVAVAGFVVIAITIVSNTFAKPSPPAGTNYAVIPQGTIPVVGTSNGGGPSVAHVNPDTTTVQPLTPQKGA